MWRVLCNEAHASTGTTKSGLLIAEIEESWRAGNRVETLRIVSESIESLKRHENRPSRFFHVLNGLIVFGALVRKRVEGKDELQRIWRHRISTIRSLLVRSFCHAALIFLFDAKYVFKLHRAMGNRPLAMFHQMFALHQLRQLIPEQARQFATNVYVDRGEFDPLVAYPTRYMFSLIQKPEIERLATFQHFHGAIQHLDKHAAASVLARFDRLGVNVHDDQSAADIARALIQHNCVDTDFVTFVDEHCGLLKCDIGAQLLPLMITRGNRALSVKLLEWSLHGPKGELDATLFQAVAEMFDDGDIDGMIRLRALAPIDATVHRILYAKVPVTSNFAFISVPFLQTSD